MLFNIVYNVYVCLDYQSNIYLFILGFEAFSSVVIFIFALYGVGMVFVYWSIATVMQTNWQSAARG